MSQPRSHAQYTRPFACKACGALYSHEPACPSPAEGEAATFETLYKNAVRKHIECDAELNAEIERLKKWNRLRSEDIMNLGQQVGKLETELAHARAQVEKQTKALDWIKANPGAHPRNILAVIEQFGLSDTSTVGQRNPCPGCDGHECDNGCAYPGASITPQNSGADK